MEQLSSEPKRKLVFPSPLDLKRAQSAYRGVIDKYVTSGPRNENLLKAVENETAKLRH